jgi:hypothetical protein
MISLCNIRWRFRVFAENFDLSYIVERDWDTLREKLNGKMHVYCGTMDNFYLNNAVYMFEARVNALVAAEDGAAGKEVRVRNTISSIPPFHVPWSMENDDLPSQAQDKQKGTSPQKRCLLTQAFSFEVDYGERAEHCWNGDQENGNHISRLRYNTMYLDKMMARIAQSSPDGADTTSWRY